VVRYNGGAQAAHNVVTPEGKHHTFAQFGSATLAGGSTLLSRHMLVNPISMLREAEHLKQLGINDPLAKVTIEDEALITNVYQVAANRIREALRGDQRHGSCGMGIGETVSDFLAQPDMAIRAEDLFNPLTLHRKLRNSFDLKREEFSDAPQEIRDRFRILFDHLMIEDCLDRYQLFAQRLGETGIVNSDFLRYRLREDRTIIFEGAQGVLLDQDYGFHPHTTWSDTTFGNALDLLEREGYEGDVRRIGILRGFHTRHGAGPLPSEFNPMSVHDDMKYLEGEHNNHNEWQQAFRVGHFDMVLAKYALKVIGGVDELVLTNLDRITRPKICIGYKLEGNTQIAALPVQSLPVDLDRQEALTRQLNGVQSIYGVIYETPKDMVRAIQEQLGSVSICSIGPTVYDKLPVEFYLNPPRVPMDVETWVPKTWN
jgi:adenylosuccinate synthase